jgi:hypothetical protein
MSSPANKIDISRKALRVLVLHEFRLGSLVREAAAHINQMMGKDTISSGRWPTIWTRKISTTKNNSKITSKLSSTRSTPISTRMAFIFCVNVGRLL